MTAHVPDRGPRRCCSSTSTRLRNPSLASLTERMGPGGAFVPSLREHNSLYGIGPDRVRSGQGVMHPGPMNRGIEIDARVADSAAALVTDQVRPGLVIHMAALYDLLTVAIVEAPLHMGMA